MWTSENRAKYDRASLRYPSDFTDAEWEHIASLIPPPTGQCVQLDAPGQNARLLSRFRFCRPTPPADRTLGETGSIRR